MRFQFMSTGCNLKYSNNLCQLDRPRLHTLLLTVSLVFIIVRYRLVFKTKTKRQRNLTKKKLQLL